MLNTLKLNDFLTLANKGKRAVIYREILADHLTPIRIANSLQTELREGAILESGHQQEDAGHYSFLAYDPIATFTVQNKTITTTIGTQQTKHTTAPFRVLRELIQTLDCSNSHHLPFVNGAIGFCTYDAVRLFENIPDRHADDTALPEMFFKFYRVLLRFDHRQQKLLINVTVEVGVDPVKTYADTQILIDAIIQKITQASDHVMDVPETKPETPVLVDIDDDEFAYLVNKAKQYIVAGDAFQIVLSRSFKKNYTVSPFDIYRTLRRESPAPYMFYIPINGKVIVGASPEKLISVVNRKVTINPIAGTRKRNHKLDQEIMDELLNDEKECAEHMMLVDLARNDLGRVCEPGSIKVDALMKVKHFSHVSHITSVVSGTLQSHCDALDALGASFPAGTLSGAPKIRAMEIIDELETSKRGLYGGIVCRLDYEGNLDSCIAIRMAVLHNGIATVRAGGGIVYDSNPQAEANETRQKAQSMLAAIAQAEMGS